MREGCGAWELDISGPDGYSFGFGLRHVLSHLSSCVHDTYRGTAIGGKNVCRGIGDGKKRDRDVIEW